MTTFDSTTSFTWDTTYGAWPTNGVNPVYVKRSGTSAPYQYGPDATTSAALGISTTSQDHDFVIDYNATDGWHIKDVTGTGSNPNFYYKGSYPAAATQTQVNNLSNAEVIYLGSSTAAYGRFTFTGLSSGSSYSGTVTRHAHSVTLPQSTDFIYHTPDLSSGRLEYEKYGNYNFRLSWFDQNEPAAGYNATVKWYCQGVQESISQQITAAHGEDITWQVETNIPGWPIDHNSDVTLHFDVDVVVNGSTITAGSAVKTFTYLAFGPITGTFTPSRGRPGDTISWEIRDTNPYPDYTSYTCSVEQEDGTSTDYPLRSTNAIPYGTSGSFATTIEGVARLYEADTNHRQSSHILAECVIKKMGKVFSNFW